MCWRIHGQNWTSFRCVHLDIDLYIYIVLDFYNIYLLLLSFLLEIFWKAMTGTMPDSYNDQNTLNHALFSLNIDWGTSNEIDIFNGDWHGTSEAGFKITIISAMKFCRQACNRHYKYYVWHKGGKGRDGKVRYASQARLWFLRQDWEMIANASSAVGNDWLRELSDAT